MTTKTPTYRAMNVNTRIFGLQLSTFSRLPEDMLPSVRFIEQSKEMNQPEPTIRKWVEQADGKNRSEDGNWAKRYQRLERDKAQLKEERDILKGHGRAQKKRVVR